ncbi:MAG: hypothetical protein DRR06_12990 [Gammaproteobacteria bacterium]|nr:MAG: hypothetical protein DRR06_12990 [Gammaproteobacteria bacterium]RLA53967.1 MAG: hypothetical protein DRR42_03280 [Gammaproteobacteria bacterium]
MPQFIIGNSIKSFAEKYPAVRNAIWFVEAGFFRIFFGLLGLLPVETASRLAQRLVMAVGPHLKKHKIFVRNIALAFPDKSAHQREVIVRGIWANVGAIVGEFPHLQTICHDEKHKRLKVVVAGHIEALQQSGKPVIIVAAHLSNWEVAGAAVAQMGIPCANAYTPMGNPWLNQMIAKYREAQIMKLFPRENSLRPMVRHLAAGQSLSFIMDQRVDDGQPVPFMGMEKMTTVVPAKLGLRFNCEIVPLRVQRQSDAQYLVTLYPPVQVDDEDADEAEKVLQITRKINGYIEQWVRESPMEWFPSKRRWDKSAYNGTVAGPNGQESQVTHVAD